MPHLITTCSGCGGEWSPERSDYLSGAWRQCPACRDDPEDPPTERPDDASTDTQKDNAS